MSDFLSFAIKIAKEAGEVLKQAQRQTFQIEEKRTNDLVTEFDKKTDAFLTEQIQANYPDHQMLTEESGVHQNTSDYCWIIDPIDGTTNFAHRIPMFAISIALQFQQQTIVGVIYNPMNNELFTAEKGKGAFLNGDRLQISGHHTLPGALLATGFPCKDPSHVPTYLSMFDAFIRQSQGVRRIGTVAIDLAYLAAGRIDGFWEIALQPWDIAAAALMVEEAGGMVCDLFGEQQYPAHGVVAGSPALCTAITAVTRPAIHSSNIF